MKKPTIPTTSIISHFSSIEDPRIERRKRHELKDIFFITLCASICGADSWVAIETFGKCLRRSLDASSDKAAIYMVSAWSSRNQLVLGQQRVDDKSNEITAIPKLLKQLDISGSVITLDAMVVLNSAQSELRVTLNG